MTKETKNETNNATRKAGRPLKYVHFVMELDDDQIYSPGTIARLGQELGFLDDIEDKNKSDARLLVRHTLARYRVNHRFPEEGDGVIRIRGQGSSTGWSGERWKSDIDQEQQRLGKEKAERLKQEKKEREKEGCTCL